MHFAYLRQSPIYHTPEDGADAVDLGSLQHHGEHALAVAGRFGAADLSVEPPNGSDVFFTVGSAWVVRYPERWAPFVAIATALLFGLAVTTGRGRSIRSVGGGAASFLLALIAGALLAAVAWRLVTSVRSSPGIAESYAYLAAMLAVLAGSAGIARRAAVRRSADWAGGVVLVWVALGLATGLALPAMSYVFTWPALCGVLAVIWTDGRPGVFGLRRLALLVVVAGPALILAIPAIDTLFQLAQPRPGNLDSQVVEVVGLVVVMGMLVIELLLVPLRSGMPDPPLEPAGNRIDTEMVAAPVA